MLWRKWCGMKCILTDSIKRRPLWSASAVSACDGQAARKNKKINGQQTSCFYGQLCEVNQPTALCRKGTGAWYLHWNTGHQKASIRGGYRIRAENDFIKMVMAFLKSASVPQCKVYFCFKWTERKTDRVGSKYVRLLYEGKSYSVFQVSGIARINKRQSTEKHFFLNIIYYFYISRAQMFARIFHCLYHELY